MREVPLLPHLVTLLAEHRCQWPDGELLFQNGAGKVPTASNYGPVWTRLRQSQWPDPHPLSKTTVYDLRHSAATLLLRSGVPLAEVARRLGHSVDVLMRVYAGVVTDERERANELVEVELSRLAL